MKHRRAALMCAVALVSADLTLSGAAGVLALRRSACGLLEAIGTGTSGEAERLRSTLARSLASGLAAAGALRSPTWRALSVLPGDDAEAASALGRALARVSASGLSAGAPLLERDDPLAALYRDGKVDLEAVGRLQRAAAGVEASLRHARSELSGLQPVLGPLRDALGVARARLNRAAAATARARRVLEALPRMLGADGPRRYLLAFQSPSEARGGGGLVGVYGIARADSGRLTLERVEPIRELVPLLRRPVRGPRWFASAYGDLLGLSEWREANLSPVFPVTSEILLRMYEASTGQRLDGVVALDPHVLAGITRATGSLKVYGLDRRVGPRNAVPTLLRDIYVEFHNREGAQNGFLKRLVRRVHDKLGSGDFEPAVLARTLLEAGASQHLKVYARDDAVQRALRALGVDGDPRRTAPTLQMVFTNNFAANKVDYFLHRTLRTQVQLTRRGDALVTVSVELDNRAPGGAPTVLTRSGIRRDLPVGLNQMIVHMVAPEDAQFAGIYVDGRRSQPTVTREAANPAASQVLQLPPRRSTVVDFLYRWPEAASDGTFELTLFPQAVVNADRFEVEVVPPPHAHLRGPRWAHPRADGSLAFSGRLLAPRRIRARVLTSPGPAELASPRSSPLSC